VAKAEETTQRCRGCGDTKPITAFGWSSKRHRPTKICKACWGGPQMARSTGKETVDELTLYYSHIRSLVEEINSELADGKTMSDVWLREMTEEAYTAIVRALITKASSGDVNASKLLLEERHRRAGEPTQESTAESFEALFNLDPLAPGMDTA
jgi:hypothetical protein